MAIYTRFGGEVTLCEARMIPVWVIKTSFETKWSYSEPRKPPKHATVEEIPMWHFRGRYVKDGHPVLDNKWIDANSLKADDGWKEIETKLMELCPDALEKYNQWNKKDAPKASDFFPPIAEKEVA